MFTKEELDIAYSILKQIQPKLAESMIFYKNSDQPDYGHVVKYMKDKHTKAV